VKVGTADSPFYRFDPDVGFWGVSNIERLVSFEQDRSQYKSVFQNEDGNRDKPVSTLTDEKTIVCLGGSHTWGGGVGQEELYTYQLEKLIGMPVVNLGHCSIGLDQVAIIIMNKALKYKPKVIVVEQYPWAIHRILNRYVNGYVKPYFYLDADKNLKFAKVPRLARFKVVQKIIGSYFAFQKELGEFRAGINLGDGYDPTFDPIFLYWKTGHYDPMYQLVEKVFIVIRDFCIQNNIKLLFALGAIRQQFGPPSPTELVDYDLTTRRIAELLDKNRIAYVDLKDPMLEGKDTAGSTVFPDGHINAKGHRVFAEVLNAEIRRRGWK